MKSLRSTKFSIGTGSLRSRNIWKTVEDFYQQFQQENRTHVKELMNDLVRLLDENNCDDLVGLEVEDAVKPFCTPVLPLIQETFEASKKKVLYEYIRKTQKRGEKIRLHLMNNPSDIIEGLFVSGRLVDYPLFNVVTEFVSLITTLKVLRLVDCSLKKEGLVIIGNLLGKTGVTHLYLDRNLIPDQNYHCVLQDNRVLEHLSLVQCHIDEKGATFLGRALGPPEAEKPTHSLKTLNMNNNRINCFAAKFLAQGLKWNRDLLFLSLAGNRIGNAGLAYISKSFQEGELENWEFDLKIKRLLKRKEEVTAMVDDLLLLKSVEELENYGMNEGESFCDEEFSQHSMFRKRIMEEYIKKDENPLSKDVSMQAGKYMTKGNKTLKAINLSYNKITDDGFEHLLTALRYQFKERINMPMDDKIKYHLTKIDLMGNFCPEKCKVVKKIAYYIRKAIVAEEQRNITEVVNEEEEENIEENMEEELEEEADEPEAGVVVRANEPASKQGRRKLPRRSVDTPKSEEVGLMNFEGLLVITEDLTDSSDEFGLITKAGSTQDSKLENSYELDGSIINKTDSDEQSSKTSN